MSWAGNSKFAGIFAALARESSPGGSVETSTIVPGFNPSTLRRGSAAGTGRLPNARFS